MPLTDAVPPSTQDVGPSHLRNTLRGFPTGVAVAAARVDGRVVGLAVSSFTSVSLTPPLVSVCFDRASSSWPDLQRAERWGISVLSEDQDEVLLGLRRASPERFSGLPVAVADDGSALVRGSLAVLTVEPHAEVDAGDHILALLRVVALRRDMTRRPLVHFDGATHRIAHHSAAEVGLA